MKPMIKDASTNVESTRCNQRHGQRMSGQHRAQLNTTRPDNRRILILIVLVVKLAYFLWYYALGISLNIGDTATYLQEDSLETFLERGDGIGFAYIATFLYSNPFTRVLIELVTLVIMCWFILRMPTNRAALIASALIVLPTSLAFMTVASKELIVFLILFLTYQVGGWLKLPPFLITVMLKPSFITLALLPVLKRWSSVATYFAVTVVAGAFVVTYYRWEQFYINSFFDYRAHFRTGNLTYDSEGFFPLTPVARVLGLEPVSNDLTAYLIGACMMFSNLILFGILVHKYGTIRGSAVFVLVLIAFIPYSSFNLGSAARYQAALLLAVALNELLNSRVRRIDAPASAS